MNSKRFRSGHLWGASSEFSTGSLSNFRLMRILSVKFLDVIPFDTHLNAHKRVGSMCRRAVREYGYEIRQLPDLFDTSNRVSELRGFGFAERICVAASEEEQDMAWDRIRSGDRIQKALQTVPTTAVGVEAFEARAQQFHNPLLRLPQNMAVLVDGAHVYVQLTDYNGVLQDAKRETSARNRRALQFLHIHYSACDSIIRDFGAQRVDFHGSRLHAVVATPPGKANERLRVERAIEMAQAIARMVEVTGQRVHRGEFQTGTRIGIDTGIAIAVNSGRGSEPEPLFLGDPANYAAKLAAGSDPGIFLSDRARALVGLHVLGTFDLQRSGVYNMRDVSYGLGRASPMIVSDARIQTLSNEIKNAAEASIRDVDFIFHQHTPPLRTIDYGLLSPSNSIHMPLVSVFADIDGFTKYVGYCIANGQVRQLVSNLHAIRYESAATLKHDFEGKKVRFIGDCLHGIVAEGTGNQVDDQRSVIGSLQLAAGLRSSFDLCKVMLPGIQQLGLAIGLEIGPTPVTRLGLRGDMSVRCVTSKTVSDSEDLQSECTGRETMVGQKALALLPADLRSQFDFNGKIRDLDVQTLQRLRGISGSVGKAVSGAAASSSAWAASAESSAGAIRNSGGNRHA
ncbi:adenylate/guanylate cyclase domain-containing protein [Rhizobium ruizarguesonis]|uniref:adenylate/guanylate cyclase domain-containing protein n=1 Tax=Rhizobium ruizarguesonis TaxID=2081791 RepID=UPI0013EE4A84|nr:adenylate/guanylate cyclase domain-containing protein [Rhizobium ruizarguesonis]